MICSDGERAFACSVQDTALLLSSSFIRFSCFDAARRTVFDNAKQITRIKKLLWSSKRGLSTRSLTAMTFVFVPNVFWYFSFSKSLCTRSSMCWLVQDVGKHKPKCRTFSLMNFRSAWEEIRLSNSRQWKWIFIYLASTSCALREQIALQHWTGQLQWADAASCSSWSGQIFWFLQRHRRSIGTESTSRARNYFPKQIPMKVLLTRQRLFRERNLSIKLAGFSSKLVYGLMWRLS